MVAPLPVLRAHVDAAGLDSVGILQADIDHRLPDFGREANRLLLGDSLVQKAVRNNRLPAEKAPDEPRCRDAYVALPIPGKPFAVALLDGVARVRLQGPFARSDTPSNFRSDGNLERERDALFFGFRRFRLDHVAAVAGQDGCVVVRVEPRVLVRTEFPGPFAAQVELAAGVGASDARAEHAAHDVAAGEPGGARLTADERTQETRKICDGVEADIGMPGHDSVEEVLRGRTRRSFDPRIAVRVPLERGADVPRELHVRRSVRKRIHHRLTRSGEHRTGQKSRCAAQKQRTSVEALSHRVPPHVAAKWRREWFNLPSAFAAGYVALLAKSYPLEKLVLDRMTSHKRCDHHKAVGLLSK